MARGSSSAAPTVARRRPVGLAGRLRAGARVARRRATTTPLETLTRTLNVPAPPLSLVLTQVQRVQARAGAGRTRADARRRRRRGGSSAARRLGGGVVSTAVRWLGCPTLLFLSKPYRLVRRTDRGRDES
eukprot:3201970-Prymnesium_polylepis.2